MDSRILRLIATVIDYCEQSQGHRRGPPPTATVRVGATLRQLLREGTPWRSSLERWARMGLFQQVHAVLVSMLRGHPDLILDSCSVRAKRGG